MNTRRAFLSQAAAGITTAALARTTWASSRPKITSVIRREETIVRSGGYGGPGSMTHTADDRLLVTIIEGMGWPGLQEDLHFQTGMFDMVGDPQSATFQVIPGYPLISMFKWFHPGGDPFYYGGALLAVDNYVYQYVSSFHGMAHWGLPQKGRSNSRVHMPDLSCTKLIYSSDHGRTWRNQDGSQPVYFEPPKNQTRESMIFWDEPRGLFAGVILLQMGKGYSENRDGYVYGYSMMGQSNTSDFGSSTGDLAMFRVPKAKVTDRKSYEFFAGRRADGSGNWRGDINACAPVHSFPLGWGCSSITYNAPLGIYMLTASQTRGMDFLTDTAESSRLGLWTAPQPWGPWEQVYEEDPWKPAGQGSFIGGGVIMPKWISADGKSVWMTWADWTGPPRQSEDYYRDMWHSETEEEYRRNALKMFTPHPNFRFNRQRVDLVVK